MNLRENKNDLNSTVNRNVNNEMVKKERSMFAPPLTKATLPQQ